MLALPMRVRGLATIRHSRRQTSVPGILKPRCPPCHLFQQYLSVNNDKGGFSNIDAGYEREKDFNPKKAILMRKTTRYEYEKRLRPYLDEKELENFLTAKGSDYKALLERHDEYHNKLDVIREALQKRNLDYRVVNNTPSEYGEDVVDWADVIFTAGGDGIFLMAATQVRGHSKPVIGINTDPERSEGFLCLPKHYSQNVDEAIDKVVDGNFKWKWRQRIRLTMSGKHQGVAPVDLYKQQMCYPENRYSEHVGEAESLRNNILEDQPPQRIPILALNEVYIGEALSARVSFYEVSMDGKPSLKQKSSGITLCTGTGSTSWHFNINNISHQSIKHILQIAQSHNACCDARLTDQQLLNTITEDFNSSLRYDPADPRMAFTIRDPIVNAVFHMDQQRGFCEKMEVHSRMYDGWVVVDGGVSFKFNDGANVELSMNHADALRCVELEL